jgi:DNA-directed RNA polymerase subunit omega
MIVPLDLLVDSEDNVYEITCASIRRAVQVTVTGDEEIENNGGKVVSTAIKQVLTKTVQYRLEE